MPRRDKEHKVERIVRLVVEEIDQRVALILKWAQTDEGRYMFNVLLTDQEQLQRFRDPMTRQQVEANMTPEDVQKYRNQMLNLSIRQAINQGQQGV